jgi:transposase
MAATLPQEPSMRGKERVQASALALIDPDARIPDNHPLRTIRRFADLALAQLSPAFDRLYAQTGRLSIPPERLLKASLLMALYSVRSERAFCEQLDYNLLFRWFLQMDFVEPSFDHSSFSKNRNRLLEHHIAQQFFDEVLAYARGQDLLSDEHFSVDGTLLEANASLKSFKKQPEDGDPPPAPPDDPGNPSVDFHGEKRSNATHRSTTDPEARLKKKGKGKEAKLVFEGHGLMENRNGFLADVLVTQASGTAERDAVPILLDQARERSFHPKTLGADKNYDTKGCVAAMRARGVTPHVARNTSGRRSAIDGRTTCQPGYTISQRIRKRIEEIWGWAKTVGGLRRSRFRGVAKLQWAAYLVGAAYNLTRLAGLLRHQHRPSATAVA